MKTSTIATLAGLLLTSALGLAATGCKVTHYGTRGGALEPGDQALCRATCDRLIEDQTLPPGSLTACQSRCQPQVRALPPKIVAARAPDSTCQSIEEACSRDTCGPRGDAPCACKKSDRRPRGRAESPAPAPAPPECQVDWDCPQDMACDAGSCR